MTMQVSGMQMPQVGSNATGKSRMANIDPITGLPRIGVTANGGVPPVIQPPAIQTMGLAGGLDAMAQAVKRLF